MGTTTTTSRNRCCRHTVSSATTSSPLTNVTTTVIDCQFKAASKNKVLASVSSSSTSPDINSSSTLLSRMTLEEYPVDDDFCDVGSTSGYVSLDGSQYNRDGENKHLFYWMFPKRGTAFADGDTTIPFIVWLTGGPGCSSSVALLTENGPCTVNADATTTTLNPYSWTEAAHVLWLDQPAGVGFSFGMENDSNEEMISEDVYWFLQTFFFHQSSSSSSSPKYSLIQNPLYIVGESFGGHYAPSIARRIYDYNQHLPTADTQVLNLVGIAIGNGLTDPEIQYQYFPDMAYNNSHGLQLISEEEYVVMKKTVAECVKLIHLCNNAADTTVLNNEYACETAFSVCNEQVHAPYAARGRNPYDIRLNECTKPPLCHDLTNMTTFMNSNTTRTALHVKTHHDNDDNDVWTSCNDHVNDQFHVDIMKDFSSDVSVLLNGGIRVLVYAGDADYICNYMGNEAWTYALTWNGGDEFRAEPLVSWNHGTGLIRTVANSRTKMSQNSQNSELQMMPPLLTYVQVFDAGHMVASDQPKVALDLITQFISDAAFSIA